MKDSDWQEFELVALLKAVMMIGKVYTYNLHVSVDAISVSFRVAARVGRNICLLWKLQFSCIPHV